jgi:inward rectifier potassium channel
MAAEYRTFNRDGSQNIHRHGHTTPFKDFYHFLLSIRWPVFFLLIICGYISINLIFSTAYYLIGPAGLSGSTSATPLDFFLDCFFFSIQTVSTIGYGHVSPASLTANIVVAIEAFCGIISVALVTGLIFARFSRPTSKVVFSDNAIITKHMGKDSLLFRMANSRLNRVAEATVSAVLLKDTVSTEGMPLRQQFDLHILRSRSLVFAASWLIIHEINEKSPLFGMTKDDLEKQGLEILVALRGFDETFSQDIHARHSYVSHEILWNVRFKDMLKRVDGKLWVDISSISHVTSSPHSANELGSSQKQLK